MLKVFEKDFISYKEKRNNSHVKSLPKIKCIYKITNLKNDLFYIGYTNDFFIRMKSHIKGSKSKIDLDINLFGKENFIFEVLYDFNKDIIIENKSNYKYHIFLEQKFINKLKPYYNEYRL